MTGMAPIHSENPSDKGICPQCGTSLPSQALFCSSCGERIVKQEDDTTVRLPSLSREHLKGLPLYRSPSKLWGWLPALSLTSAAGVFLVALAYEGGRVSARWGEPLFWFGLLVLFLPGAWRLFSARPARRERIALLLILAISLYLVKFLQYPLHFAAYDEFLHWRTALDIAASGHLFHKNPLLPISSYYPGLEIVTTALSGLTGLSLFASGTVLIGVIQLVFVLALYLFYEHFTDSARVAGIATVLYMANPNFLFFDTDFAYESLALPLALLVLFMVARRSQTPAGKRKSLTLAIWLGLGAVVVTHHLTSYALVAFLILWTIVSLLLRVVPSFHQNRPPQVRAGPGAIAIPGIVLCFVWLIYTGDLAIGYLSPHIDNTVHQFVQILSGSSPPRQLFHNASGFVVPLWERAISYISVALIVLGLPFGLFRIWQQHRTNAAILTLAGVALAYPVSQALRLTPAGGETGDRATEFVFLGVVFVLAIGATQFWFSHASSWRRRAIIIAVSGVICFGQMVLGSGQPWSLLPGPFLVSADARSIEPEGITAAEWASSYLGSGQRIASDRINTLLMATYGGEQAETSGSGNIPIALAFTSLQFGSGVVAILQQDRIQYLVIDRRLSTSLPYVGTYFNQPASGGPQSTGTIAPVALTKFDDVPYLSKIFDSGDIVIYDVKTAANGLSATSTSTRPCVPAQPTAVSTVFPKVAELYHGNLYDIATGLAANISLTGIQQKRGNICGYMNGIPSNGPFKGTITTGKQIQFTLSSGTEKGTFSFNGVLLPGGGMTGSFCGSRADSEKCDDYGLWTASPTLSG